jgi:predicted transposase YbfD/YdcC
MAETATDELEGLAADGKTLRGSRKQGAIDVHLLSIVSHRLGLTLKQQAVSDKTNEIPVLPDILKNLALAGKVLTMDALNTQRETAQTIIDNKADYVMAVKENQPQLLEQIETVFQYPEQKAEQRQTAEQFDLSRGRIEMRRLTASSILSGYSDWPGLAQVFKLEREVSFKNSNKQRQEIVYGVTSLAAQKASALQLLNLVRGQWTIENKSHYVRDVTFDEDHSQVRTGSIPQVMAALRNTAIGLMRWAGKSNIAAACRWFAAQPCAALSLIGFREN